MPSFIPFHVTEKSPISQFWQEIKWRVFYCFLSSCITFYCCYSVSPDLFFWVTLPCHQSQTEFVFLNLPEAFYTTLTLSGLFTWCFCLPFFWYQWWSFFVPSLTKNERSKVSFVTLIFFFLYIGSLGLTFFGITPILLDFLLKFQVKEPSFSIQYQATLSIYISWIRSCLFSTFFICQWPTVLYICLLFEKITPQMLTNYRKNLFLICILLGATISPPEIFLQLSLTFFFWVYTEFVFWVLFITAYKENSKQ